MSLICLVNNSDEDESPVVEKSKIVKKRSTGKTYFFQESFETLELAQKALEEERIWSKEDEKFYKTVSPESYSAGEQYDDSNASNAESATLEYASDFNEGYYYS